MDNLNGRSLIVQINGIDLPLQRDAVLSITGEGTELSVVCIYNPPTWPTKIKEPDFSFVTKIIKNQPTVKLKAVEPVMHELIEEEAVLIGYELRMPLDQVVTEKFTFKLSKPNL